MKTTKTIDDFNAMTTNERKSIMRRAIERNAMRKTLKNENVIAIRNSYRETYTVDELRENIIAVMNTTKTKSNVDVDNAIAMFDAGDNA